MSIFSLLAYTLPFGQRASSEKSRKGFLSMGFFRVVFGVVSRSQGGSSVNRAAYQNCEKIDKFNHSKKSDEFVMSKILSKEKIPFENSGDLWRSVEANENRKDAQVSRKFEVSIPHSVPPELYEDFADAMFQDFADINDFVIDYAIHDAPHTFKDDSESPNTTNVHIHAQMSMRPWEGNCWGKKDRNFNNEMRLGKGDDMKERFAAKMNQFFLTHNIKDKVVAPSQITEVNPVPVPEVTKKTIRIYQSWQKDKSKTLPKVVSNFLVNRKSAKHQKRLRDFARTSGAAQFMNMSQPITTAHIEDGLERLRLATQSYNIH